MMMIKASFQGYTPPRHWRQACASNVYTMASLATPYSTGRGALKIHPGLLEMFDASFVEYHISIALMRDNRQWHDMKGHVGCSDEHGVKRVLSRLAVDIPKALDHA